VNFLQMAMGPPSFATHGKDASSPQHLHTKAISAARKQAEENGANFLVLRGLGVLGVLRVLRVLRENKIRDWGFRGF